MGGNFGKGAAVKAGVLAASGRRVAFMDADLAMPPEEFLKLWEAVEGGAEIAIASRHLEGSIVENRGLLREMMGRIFNWLVSALVVDGFRDTQCGFKLFSREAALALFKRLETRGFAFDVELLARARRRGLPVKEVPVRWVDDGESRVRPVRDSLAMFRELFAIRRRLK
jgi:dolichyl-phosphate beta-glucosyltransferase